MSHLLYQKILERPKREGLNEILKCKLNCIHLLPLIQAKQKYMFQEPFLFSGLLHSNIQISREIYAVKFPP